MSSLDKTILAIDTWFYLTWIYCVIRYRKDWDAPFEKEDKD